MPVAGLIKKNFPNSRIYFLGRTYTKDVILLSEHVDEFIDYDELQQLTEAERTAEIKAIKAHVFLHIFPEKNIAHMASSSNIPLRVGTTNRLYHWFTCNKLIRLSRKNSNLHEAQLNIKLLGFLKINTLLTLTEIPAYYGFSRLPVLQPELMDLIDTKKFNLILHPKSKGSAKEWGVDNFDTLINLLPKNKFKIFVTGTAGEGRLMTDLLKNSDVVDLTGKLSLKQLIAFIKNCDGLVAASTGPLHIAAALGKKTIGLFVPKRPMHPDRWMPVGTDAHYLVFDPKCQDCKKTKDCNCIGRINPQEIIDLLKNERL